MNYLPIAALLLAFALPSVACAARLSLEPATLSLAAGERATIKLVLQSEEDINALGVALSLPEGLTYLRTEKGVVLGQWVDIPAFDSKNSEVTFSGIMPGGWKGNAVLATVAVLGAQAGTYSLAYDEAHTQAYLNDGKATPAPLEFGAASHATRSVWPLWAIAGALALLIAGIILVRKIRIKLV